MNGFSKIDTRMAFTKEGSKWWRGFLGTSPNRDLAATEILRQQYVEEMQGIGQLPQHAYKMQYPQFREKLLHIAADKSKHAEWITEKIAALGGKLPDVPERRSTDANSWQSLVARNLSLRFCPILDSNSCRAAIHSSRRYLKFWDIEKIEKNGSTLSLSII
jgi:hypothetical protein